MLCLLEYFWGVCTVCFENPNTSVDVIFRNSDKKNNDDDAVYIDA